MRPIGYRARPYGTRRIVCGEGRVMSNNIWDGRCACRARGLRGRTKARPSADRVSPRKQKRPRQGGVPFRRGHARREAAVRQGPQENCFFPVSYGQNIGKDWFFRFNNSWKTNFQRCPSEVQRGPHVNGVPLHGDVARLLGVCVEVLGENPDEGGDGQGCSQA